MKYDQYVSLIQRLEKSAASNRSGYELKVLLLIVLGYAYFAGLILLFVIPIPILIALLVVSPEAVWRLAIFGGKLLWVLIPGLAFYFGFIGSALRSVTAKVPDPDGTQLKRADAPELFAFVDSTCKSLKAQRPAKILMTDSFNAAIVTMPRFGIIGRKVLMIIGLPLMKALSPSQFEAVLAHEIGHISGKHGVFVKWAYQMREAWGRLIDSQDATEHKFAALYKRFVDWFFPYFTAYSFVLMREHEKDADRDAADLVGARPLGEALISLETKGQKLDEEFWRGVHEENIASDKPSELLFTRMMASLAFVSEDRARTSLAKAVAVPTDFNDSHPSLADRLRLIGYWTNGDLPQLPVAVEHDAASEFLGIAATAKFTAEFDAVWDEQAGQTWKDRHDYFQQSQKRLTELDDKALGELTLDELREIAQLKTEKDGHQAAKPAIEEAARRFPDDAVVWFNLGLLRLSEDDESGLAHLDKAIATDQSLQYDSCQLAFDYLRGKGKLEEAKKYVSVIEEQNEILERANKERAAAHPTDTFEMHDLSEEFIASIPKKLAGLEEIAALYAVHKKVEHMPEYPYRVLFVELRPKARGDAEPAAIFEIITERLDTGEIHFFALLDQHWGDTGKRLDSITGARIYHKSANS